MISPFFAYKKCYLFLTVAYKILLCNQKGELMNSYQKNILLKKNVILIPADYDGVSNQKGVLTLEYQDDKIVGSLRCYNLKPTAEVFSVGLQVGDSTFKTKATAKELSNLKLILNATATNASKVNCVIVSLNGDKYTTLLWGSTEITKSIAENYFVESLLEKTQILTSQENAKKESQKPATMQSKSEQIESQQDEIFEDELLENYIDKVMSQTSEQADLNKASSESNSAENNYSFVPDFEKTFVQANNSTKIIQNEQNTSSTFFGRVENQIQTLFDSNQADVTLEKIIPDSKFCKVQNGEEFYVFGVIYQEGKPRCICYGIPADYSSVPPAEVDGLCQWLPLDSNNYQGKGYWMTYQDAITGDNIVVELVS